MRWGEDGANAVCHLRRLYRSEKGQSEAFCNASSPATDRLYHQSKVTSTVDTNRVGPCTMVRSAYAEWGTPAITQLLGKNPPERSEILDTQNLH